MCLDQGRVVDRSWSGEDRQEDRYRDLRRTLENTTKEKKEIDPTEGKEN